MELPLGGIIENVRKKRPLVLHVTNSVTVNDCANVTICAGGSPVMSEWKDDASQLASKASAVVLNIGTAKPCTVSAMIAAGKAANANGVPVILDPVGVGASEYRFDTVRKIMDEVKVSVIKGNAGEIAYMAGANVFMNGVDSFIDTDMDAAVRLAKETDAVVAMSGSVDYVSDGKRVFSVSNGTPAMERVSGTGCMLSSVAACYAAAGEDIAESVAAAMAVFSVAGEIAESRSSGPGSFRQALMDSLFGIDAETVIKMAKVECLEL